MEPTMRSLALVGLVLLSACSYDGGPRVVDQSAPTNVAYELTPSGDPFAPSGLLMTWDPPANGRALTYEVYGRSGNGGFGLRATTTSPSFHDVGLPQAEYYVRALDASGAELGRSETIVVDERYRLAAPQALTSITLNGAVQLIWSDNVVRTDVEIFSYYRVYSALQTTVGGCDETWYLEGTTSGEAFIVTNLDNGVGLCFAVSAVSFDGHESLWSNLRFDMPRVDARNVRLYVATTRPDSGAFVFFEDGTRRTGVVTTTARPDADVMVQRLSDGTFWLVPGRLGSTVQQYGIAPVTELTSIDRAPSSGYSTNGIRALPGYGYVLRLEKADGVHYAGLRVAYVGDDHVVFDWSYQPGVGAELSRTGGGE
jgi:hypothetical protein